MRPREAAVNSTMFVALLLAAFGPAGSEAASSAAVPGIETSGSCPSAEQVSATLAPLLGSLAPGRLVEGATRVDDLGDRFDVAAAGQTRQYVDAARDCSERARVAAVFIALALNPPAAPTVPRVDARPLAERPASEAIGSPWWARLALGGRIDQSPTAEGRSSPPVSLGGELGAVFGKRALGVAVAAGVLAPTVVSFGAVPVREQRFPFRVAAALRHKIVGPFELAGDLGVSFALLRLRGEDLDTIEPATRLDVGGRAGVELSLSSPASSWAPFVALHLEYFPRPYEFEVGPLGRVGSTNHLWVGASAGLAWQTEAARYPTRQ
jgi:hypothetical protein